MNILKTPIYYPLGQGCRLVHYIHFDNTPLQYTALEIYEMDTKAILSKNSEGVEACIVVLEGKCTVRVGGLVYSNLGTRSSVFERIPTDSVYVGLAMDYEIEAEATCKVAIAQAPTDKVQVPYLISSDQVKIEHRGANQNKRMVHTMLSDQDSISEKLLVVEVFTESGNFSSYPPHKHDVANLPEESLLEEIYYHQVFPEQGFVFQRVYTDDLLLDQTVTCSNKDIVIVPKGYHPVGVPDGYSSYYLNVMAGPTKVWKFYDDPAHSWTKERGQ